MSNDELTLRRIVTGQNAQNRSFVLLDGPPAVTLPLRKHEALHEIWTHLPDPRGRTDEVDHGAGKVVLSPPPKGIKFRWFTLEPALSGSATTEAEYSQIFDLIGGGDARPDTSRHPSMHLTQTVDFIVLLRGKVRLMLDDDERVISPGDVVVQRGTNHAWICESDEPALLIAVLIDAEFAN